MTEGLRLKRVYDAPEPGDGFRVLVDRLWPRGLSRQRACLDLWCKQIAPSPGLRTWWDHDPARFAAFTDRYRAELTDNPTLEELGALLRDHPSATLLYAARDPQINHAIVLRDVLQEHAR
ncbi:DUF488 domain-containing protein [Microbacterium sp. C7(2022)]|uniref:DUF488 domain-containing protein n=1 Tax=Microbacterium sp. C7(2022) TaxID=2992759 RepID=UPI00237A9318|nr:DUF488 family protein [Microbacterium sp. C7(2022)]MDE0545510.1 DUF488 family protein [Microbacterium sp. C7(2022)]